MKSILGRAGLSLIAGFALTIFCSAKALAACPPTNGGITVTVQNTNGAVLQGATVFIYIPGDNADPANGGGGLTLQRTTNASGQVCVQRDETTGGTVTNGFWSAVAGDGNFADGDNYVVWVTMAGFLTHCQNQAHTPSGGSTCGTNGGAAVTYSSAGTNATTQQLMPSVRITAERAVGATNTAVNFLVQPVNRVESVTLGATEDTYVATRMYSTTANQLLWAPSAFQNNQTVVLKYKGFQNSTTTAQFSPNALAQSQVDYDATDGPRLIPNLVIPVNANEVTDELNNDLSALAQGGGGTNLSMSSSAGDGNGATVYAITYNAAGTQYLAEAWSGTGGTFSATLVGYVNSTVNASGNCVMNGAAQRTAYFRTAADGANCDGDGFKFPLLVNVADELSGSSIVTPATLAGGTRTFNGQAATQVVGNSLYWAQNTNGAGAALMLRQGDMVNADATNAAFAASVSTSATAQTIINLGKSSECTNALAAGSAYNCKGLAFPIKVRVADELGSNAQVTSGSVTATFNGNNPIAQAGAASHDSNTLYFNQVANSTLAVTQAGYINGQVTNAGFAFTSTNTGQVSISMDTSSACGTALTATAAGHNCRGLSFPLKVVIADEMGSTTNVNATTLTARTFNGVGPVAILTASNAIYWAVTQANANLVLQQTNYVNAEAVNTGFTGNVSTNNSGQTSITLGDNALCTAAIAAGATSSCRGLMYPLKVNVSDQLSSSAAVTPANLTTKTFNGQAASLEVSNSIFWAVSATNAALVIGLNGYVDSNTGNAGLSSFTTNATGQTVVNLGASAVCGGGTVNTAAVNNCLGLQYSHRLGFTREGDVAALAPNADVVSVSVDGQNVCSAKDANFVYCALPTASDQANDQISASFTAMVNMDKSVTSTARANNAAAQTQLTVDNVLFPLRVEVANELSNSVTVNATALTTKTFNGQAATVNASNQLYWAVVANGALVLQQTDFVNAEATNTGFANVTTVKTNQTFIRLGNNTNCTAALTGQATPHTCRGLMFPLRLVIADELSNSATVNQGTVTAAFNGNAGTANGDSLYIDEVGTFGLTLTQAGYVNNQVHNTGFANITTNQTAPTVINLGNSTNCATAIVAGSSNNCRGMMFTLKVNIADELSGSAVTPTTLTTKTFNGVAATTTSGNSLYWAAANGAANLVLQETGYVNAEAINTAFTGNITTNNTVGQVVINLGNSNACTAAINASAVANCKGLMFPLKVIFANFQGNTVSVTQGNFSQLNFSAGAGVAGYAVAAASGNTAYFSSSLASGRLNFTSSAGKDPNNDPSGFSVNTININNTAQTTIEFGAYAVLVGAGATFGPGTTGTVTQQARGFATNVVIDVCSDYPTGTDLTTKDCPYDNNKYAVKNLNIGNFFPKTATGTGGTYVSPSAFLEGSAGRYLLTVPLTANAIDVINMQTDSDASLDYKNVNDVTSGQGGFQFNAGWTTANLSASAEPQANRLCFTSTDPSVGTPSCEASPFSVVAGQVRQLWVSLRDNDATDRLIGEGAESDALQATITVTGGPGDLASATSGSGIIFSNNASPSQPLASSTVTLTDGKAEIRIRGGKVTGTQFSYALAPAGGQIFPSASQTLNVAVTTGAAESLTIQSDVTQAIAGTPINISASIADAYGNLVNTATNAVTFTATGTPTGAVAAFTVNNTAATAGVLSSSINTTVSSSQSVVASAPGVASSNPLVLNFIPGNATALTFNPAVVTPVINADGTITDGTVQVEILDANGNVLTNNSTLELDVTARHTGTFAAAVPLAEFPSISNSQGTIVSDNSTTALRSVRVRVNQGRAVLHFRSIVANTVQLSASIATQPNIVTASQATIAAGPFNKVVFLRPDESLLPGSSTGITGTAFSTADAPETGTAFVGRVYATDAYFNQTTNGVPTALTLTSPADSAVVTNDTAAAQAATGIPANFSATGLATLSITPTKSSNLDKPTVFTATAGAQSANIQIVASVDLTDPALNLANILPAYTAGPPELVDGTPAVANNTVTINGALVNNGSSQTVLTDTGAKQAVTGPNTSDNPAQQLGSNSGISGSVLITVYDKFGNAAPNVPIDMVVNNVVSPRAGSLVVAAGNVISPVGGNITNNNGQAVFDLSNITNSGKVEFQARITAAGRTILYGDPLRVAFNADSEAPTITASLGASGNALTCGLSGDTTSLTSTTTAGACFVSGDLVQIGQPLVIYLAVQDKTTTNAAVTGVDTANVTVSIDNGAALAIPVNCEAENTTHDNKRNCTITIPAFNTAGSHSMRLRVADRAGNITTQDFILNVAGGAALTNVINGPNPFNPVTQPTKISFQSGEPVVGIVEIYSLAGFIVRRIPVNAATAGYHEVVWDGRDDGRRIVANGIYPYRVKVRSTVNGAKLVGKGKIAVIK